MKRSLLNFGHKAGLILLVAAMMAVTSCRTSSSSMPPIPEEYDGDTIEECYYIVGTLSSSGSALEGATITAGGATATSSSTGEYQLTIAKENFAAETIIEFSKSDYLTIESTAVFSSSTTGTTVIVDASLTKKAEPETVSSTTTTEISVGEDQSTSTTTATITIEAGVVAEGTTLSTTPYTPGNTSEVVSSEATTTESTVEDVTAPASVLAMEFSDEIDENATFTIDMPLSNSAITRASSEGYAFSNVKAVKYENSAWKSLENEVPTFNSSHYEVIVTYGDLTDGKSISVSISPTFTVLAAESTSQALIDPFVIDNLGKTAVVSQDVSYTMKQGLVYDAITCVDSDYCSDTIKSEMATYLATMLGASFDNSDLTFTETVNASGDSMVSVTYNQSYRIYSITAEVCSIKDDGTLNNDTKSVTYSAKYYGAVTRKVEEQSGDLGYSHND